MNIDHKVAFVCMQIAVKAHKGQVRKYTGNHYSEHLGEVAGIISTIYFEPPLMLVAQSVAWLHDIVEDTDTTYECLKEYLEGYREGGKGFTPHTINSILEGVKSLTDQPRSFGNRAARKEDDRERLSKSSFWVKSVKCADLISNTKSIVDHDKNFAKLYLEEKKELLKALEGAHQDLLSYAWEVYDDAITNL